MRNAIDYNDPLGISKREWIKVLGANLALLLFVYAIAIICTLCGLDVFLIDFDSASLQSFENTLRGWNLFSMVQALFATIEFTMMYCYIAKTKPKWWYSLLFFATLVALSFALIPFVDAYPSWLNFVITTSALVGAVFAFGRSREKWFVYLCRFAIAETVTLILSYGITLFRLHGIRLWSSDVSNSIGFAFSVEYDLALGLSLGFLTLAIPWKRKGGNRQWTYHGVSGSCPNASPSSRNSSRNAPNKLVLDKETKRRYTMLKLSMMAMQTLSLALVAIVPWFFGRQVEFALVFASFTLIRLVLGFDRSFHAESETVCIFVGALIFWALTLLTTDVQVSVIISLAYGGGVAICFRLYWELHDLMMYRKAAKTDRYAMLYCFFDGNLSPDYIGGAMTMFGYTDAGPDIKMVQMYMAKEKVEYIAKCVGYAKITVEKRLTEIATDLYARR